MYRLNEIVSSFATLVGWKDTALSSSESGLYYQEAHPLLTLRALRGVMPKDLGAKYAEYAAGTEYSMGDKVKYQGKYYICEAEHTTASPAESGWAEWDLLNDFLISLTEGGIKKVVTKFVNEKVVGMETKNLVDRRTLFDGAGRIEARTPNKGRLVGFEITPVKAEGIVTTINKVGIQMRGNVGSVRLYLFHSSQPDPLATKDIEIASDKGIFSWVSLDWALPYVNERINAGGSWYIVYDQSALPPYMESINFGRDWSREPCGTCNKGSLELYRTLQRFVRISPFYVAKDSWDEKLWDIADNMYNYSDNYGLNFMVSVACDITETIKAERHQFASAVQLQVAADGLRQIALNPEVSVNRVQSNAERDSILFEVAGNGQGIKGLQGELDDAYKALSVDMKGLDPICMGCHNKGITYRSI